MSFVNKVVIVTGASSGIGEATAKLFAKEGADVVIVGRNDVKLKAVVAKCEKVGKKPLKIIADIIKKDQTASIIAQTIDKFGKIDVLVNNAGILRFGKIIDGTIMNVYDDVINTNLRPAIHLTTLATPYLIKTKGNIINISSVVGVKATKNNLFLAYTISKNALIVYFGQGAAIELAPYGVRVNTISPGPVDSDIWESSNMTREEVLKVHDFKVDRKIKLEEIADMALYLASDKAIGITGSNHLVDNGFVLFN